MKRTLLSLPPDGLPADVREFIGSAPVFDSSCSPEAKVFFIDRDGGYYLKRALSGTLAREAEMTSYFHSRRLGAEVVLYRTEGEFDYFLTRAVKGEDCTHASYLAEPQRLAELLGERLRALHELDTVGCPVTDRVGEYLALADANYISGNYDTSHFPDSFGYESAESARLALERGRGLLKNEVLIHGDYCLPNVMLDGWRFSAFIDVDHGGIGDRHIDLFWGAWTLAFNTGTDRYKDRFFDAYGRDIINEEALLTVAAAEVFG